MAKPSNSLGTADGSGPEFRTRESVRECFISGGRAVSPQTVLGYRAPRAEGDSVGSSAAPQAPSLSTVSMEDGWAWYENSGFGPTRRIQLGETYLRKRATQVLKINRQWLESVKVKLGPRQQSLEGEQRIPWSYSWMSTPVKVFRIIKKKQSQECLWEKQWVKKFVGSRILKLYSIQKIFAKAYLNRIQN